ncbi:efflux RND transporter permease subunit, partial [Rhodopseudomonas sp. BR0C11]|uniref:efflux RND transporter permease subunit n=1 Tax=Rhodopseudomonas sp. BR0C11 TaxID=2269370 RepID=UPI0013E0A108
MGLNVSSWSIRHPLPSIVFSIILLALGWISFTKLAVTRLPSADIPVISVAVSQFGAAPAELEAQVTKTIEDGVSGVEGVRHIASSITDGLSVTTIQFALETNTDRALNDVKDAVTRVRANLPQNINEPLIQRVDVIGLPIVTYAAISPGKTPEQLSWFVDDVVKRALQGVRGVAQVERIGGVEREILVSLDPDRLKAAGLTALDVSRRLRGTNVDLAGGRAEIGNNDQAIRTLAGARTLNDLAGAMISLNAGGEVRLDDLGTVTDTIASRHTFARFNGEPVVALGIKRSKGASDVVVAEAVQKRIDALKAQYPDVELKLIDTSVDYTKGNYEAAISTLFEGAILAVIVVFLFLRDFRATVIAAISLPLSIFPAFWAMDMLGFSLNLVSFLAITLSTGILVDDAIVEIENIVRHMRMGKSPYQAAIEAADEIGLAVIAISLTIIAIFAPASFMSGIAGQFFKQFGITVSVQVFFSLLAARFVTPVLAAYFLKDHPHVEKPPGRVLRAYTRVVTWSVQHYYITVLIGLGIFAASIWSIVLLPQGFLPAQDTARSVLAMQLPPGTQIGTTEKTTEAIVKLLRERPEVKSVFVDGGRVPPGIQEVRRASLIINYTPKHDRSITQRDLEHAISRQLDQVPDIRYWFLDENGLRAISLVVTGDDSAVVNNVAQELASQMKRIPLISNVISETALDRPELRIRPRADLAARLGVSTESLSETIRVATIGDVGPALAKFDAGDRLVPIRVQLEDSARGELATLEQLQVPIYGGRGAVPLSVVADVKFDQGPTSINRYDRLRQATVAADLVGNSALGDATKQINELPVMKSLPKGVKVSPSGDAENLAELSDGFATAISGGLMMVYAVLVLLFGTFLQPITILFSLPLSIGGAIGALLLTGKQLTTPVWIGILMLMGIVTKNAIMLIEFAMEAMREGKSRDAAIIDAGQKRARPIVMTTIAMVAGMMPSALAFGAGGEFRSP